jgi:hypothetical protein
LPPPDGSFLAHTAAKDNHPIGPRECARLSGRATVRRSEAGWPDREQVLRRNELPLRQSEKIGANRRAAIRFPACFPTQPVSAAAGIVALDIAPHVVRPTGTSPIDVGTASGKGQGNQDNRKKLFHGSNLVA